MKALMPRGILLGMAGAAIGRADVLVLDGVRESFADLAPGQFVSLQIARPAKAGPDQQNRRASNPNQQRRTAELSQDDQRSSQKESRQQEPFSVHVPVGSVW